MSEQDNTVNEPTQEIVEPTDNDTVEQKLGDILPETKPDEVVEQKPEDKKPDDSVALAKFLAEKKARKALEKKVKEYEAIINSEVEDDDEDSLSTDIKSIAKEYDVDEKFLKKLSTSLKSEIRKEYDEKLKPITQKEKENQFNQVFQKHFTETIDSMPEYKSVVNADVIKSLSRDPQNANLTMRELVEKTYSNALGGKRTIETTVPNGGKDPQNIDFDKAQKDPEYYAQIMADPSQKDKYNSEMMRRFQRGF